jgi:hypothetical protein
MNTQALHPALLRTTDAIASIGARQGVRSLPVIAHALAVLGLGLGAIASIVLA